jgi:hypothetical protein
VTGLMDALNPVAPADPDAVSDHPLAQRLDTDRQAMDLGQLLGRQRRPEILVALTDDSQAGLAEGRAVRAVAGLATALGDQGVRGPWARKAPSSR